MATTEKVYPYALTTVQRVKDRLDITIDDKSREEIVELTQMLKCLEQQPAARQHRDGEGRLSDVLEPMAP